MIYLINILFCFIFSLIYDLNKRNKILLLVLIVVMSLLPAFRSIDVGTDTSNYVEMFQQFGSSNFYELFEYPTEKGYVLLNYFSSYLSSNYLSLSKTTKSASKLFAPSVANVISAPHLSFLLALES